MAIQAFIDESGIDAVGPVVIFAGVIARAEEWIAFSDDWQRVLASPPAMKEFKMQQAHHGPKHKKLRALVPVMEVHPFTIIYCSVDLSGFAETITPNVPKPLSEPYFFPFHTIICATAFHLLIEGSRERFEIIFDENVVFGPRAKAWYPAATFLMPPEVQAIMPVEPMFQG